MLEFEDHVLLQLRCSFLGLLALPLELFRTLGFQLFFHTLQLVCFHCNLC